MNKVILGSAMGAVAIVAVGAGSLVVTDQQVNKAIADMQASVMSPMTVTILEDSNTLVKRSVTFELAIDDEQMPVEFIIANELTKRPWGTQINHEVRLSESMIAGIQDAQLRDYVQTNLMAQPLLTGATQMSMTGSYQTDWLSIGIDEQFDEIGIKWHPLSIQATGSQGGDLNLTGQWPGFEMVVSELEDVTAVFKPMEFSAEGEYINGAVFVGEQIVSGLGFSVESTSEWQNESIDIRDYQISSVAEIVDNNYQADLMLNSNGFSLTTEDMELVVDDMRMGMGLGGIDTDNYQTLVQGLNAMQVNGGTPDDELMAALNQLLRDGFELSLDDWHASVDNSDFDFQGRFELPENNLADVNNPFSFMSLVGSISVAAELNMDSALAEIPELSSLLMPVLMTGALVSEGDQYLMSFDMTDGVATLNGEPLPLPF